MRETVTCWSSETVGAGSVINDVQFAYNDFGQLTHDYQAHDSAVNTSTTPKVQYGYASGAANTSSLDRRICGEETNGFRL